MRNGRFAGRVGVGWGEAEVADAGGSEGKRAAGDLMDRASKAASMESR